MTQQSISYTPGECIATFTDTATGDIVRFTGETFSTEDELLGEITMKSDRAERSVSADGKRDVIIQNMARAAERDITILLGVGSDSFESLLSFAQKRIQVIFDFDFQFIYHTDSSTYSRIHQHKRCFFPTIPVQSIGKDKRIVTAKISFLDVAVIDPSTGQEI